jgi:pimeloyl-ACP methyl ester carboxylesterase
MSRREFHQLAAGLATGHIAGAGAATGEIRRQDLQVTTSNGVRLFARRVARADAAGPVVILVHDARVPGIASFDLSVPGGSLAGDLAQAGLRVWLFDARGFGASQRPAAMDRPPAQSVPLTRAYEVVRDLEAVVREAKSRENVPRVALLGWATGAMWSGCYAALAPEEVSHLVYYNGLYGGASTHPTLGPGSAAEDPARPGRFNHASFGAWRANTAASLTPAWDRSFDGDPVAFRDPAVVAAYTAAALASDSTSASREPPAFRSPSGAMEDSYHQASGRQVFDASSITAQVLIVRSSRDFWSREADVLALQTHLTRAAGIRTLRLEGASHFVHLDREAAGRSEFMRAVRDFLLPARG